MLIISDQQEKDEYLNKHIPYRINSMLAHDLIMHRKQQPHFSALKDPCYGDSSIVEPIFEISLIFGRTLLNFLGLTFANNSIQRFSPQPNDLTIKSLFPEREYCPLNDELVVNNSAGLIAIIKFANKSVAHLTSTVSETKPDEYNILPSARQAIYKLVLKHVPEVNKEQIWWYKQVESH